MKKIIVKCTLILSTVLLLVNCNSNKEEAESSSTSNTTELKGFLVGGMYFMNGFGGVSAVESMASQNGNDKDNLISAYKDLFILPFKTEQASDIKSTLKEWWDINNKEELIESLENLKTKTDPENPHKAWNYARIVNNACMGYAAGYLTDIEAKKYVADNLIVVEKEFNDWKSFMDDFNLGRKIWDPEARNTQQFNEVTSDIFKNKNGIYQLIPLK